MSLRAGRTFRVRRARALSCPPEVKVPLPVGGQRFRFCPPYVSHPVVVSRVVQGFHSSRLPPDAPNVTKASQKLNIPVAQIVQDGTVLLPVVRFGGHDAPAPPFAGKTHCGMEHGSPRFSADSGRTTAGRRTREAEAPLRRAGPGPGTVFGYDPRGSHAGEIADG
jgi:hypothetical protein